jgi:hypothetical protein
VRIELSTYRGHSFVNLRSWFRGNDGEWHATKRGVTVRLRELPELIAALQRLGAGAAQ